MTAVLTGILVLALWLALAPPGGAGRRLRRVLAGPSPGMTRAQAATRRGGLRGLYPPRRGRSGAAREIPMAVVVQQLAALLKGGRAPARLWEELWLIYGDRQPPDQPPDEPPDGIRRHRGGAVRAGVLGAASRDILAAARAAALRGSPVAAAIRQGAGRGPGRAAPRGPGRREQAVWVDLAACFDVAEASGCPLADVLTRFAAHLEAEDDAEAARETALAGPKATVRILTWLPFLGLGLGVLLGVDPAAILLGTPLGMAALGAGLVLTAAGRIWSARLVAAAAGRLP